MGRRVGVDGWWVGDDSSEKQQNLLARGARGEQGNAKGSTYRYGARTRQQICPEFWGWTLNGAGGGDATRGYDTRVMGREMRRESEETRR